jgi:hypothetical protein
MVVVIGVALRCWSRSQLADSYLTQQHNELASLALWHLWPDH